MSGQPTTTILDLKKNGCPNFRAAVSSETTKPHYPKNVNGFAFVLSKAARFGNT